MRAAFFDPRARTFTVAEIPKPTLAPDMVLVRVEMVGVCGSDLHFARSGLYAGAEIAEPQILGHEFSGVVEQVGAQVRHEHLTPGVRVAVEPTISCGRCEYCLAGRGNICPTHVFRGMPPHPGGLQEFTPLPPENLFPVPPRLGPDPAMLAEPLAIAIHSRRIAAIRGGETVAVVGCGPLGLLITKMFHLAGADIRLAVEPIPERRRLAVQCGAERALSPDDDVPDALSDLTSGRLVDLVVEAAGPPEALALAMRLVRPGGTLIYVGIHPGPMHIDFTLPRRREMVWKWVRRAVHAYPEAIDLLATGRIDAADFVTHRWPLEAVAEAFETASAYRDGIIKGAIEVASTG